MLALNTLRLATVLTHLSKCYNHKCNHLCDTMWNLWASLCKKILLDNSPLTQIANLYKLSSCWSHARCRNLSISIPEQTFFCDHLNICAFVKLLTHSTLMSMLRSGFYFLSQSYHLNICAFVKLLTHSTLMICRRKLTKWVYCFLPNMTTMGLLFCPKIFSFTQSLHYHVSQLRVHGFNFLSQIHFHFVKALFILSEEESLNKY